MKKEVVKDTISQTHEIEEKPSAEVIRSGLAIRTGEGVPGGDKSVPKVLVIGDQGTVLSNGMRIVNRPTPPVGEIGHPRPAADVFWTDIRTFRENILLSGVEFSPQLALKDKHYCDKLRKDFELQDNLPRILYAFQNLRKEEQTDFITSIYHDGTVSVVRRDDIIRKMSILAGAVTPEVKEQIEEHVDAPLDEEGFPIVDPTDLRVLDFVGLQRDPFKDAIETAKESIRALRAEVAARNDGKGDDILMTEEERSLFDSANTVLYQHWKTIYDLKKLVPDQTVLLGKMTKYFDDKYYFDFLKRDSHDKNGILVSLLTESRDKQTSWTKEFGRLEIFQNPVGWAWDRLNYTKFNAHLESSAYFFRKIANLDVNKSDVAVHTLEQFIQLPITVTNILKMMVSGKSDQVQTTGMIKLINDELIPTHIDRKINALFVSVVEYIDNARKHTSFDPLAKYLIEFKRRTIEDSEKLKKKKTADSQKSFLHSVFDFRYKQAVGAIDAALGLAQVPPIKEDATPEELVVSNMVENLMFAESFIFWLLQTTAMLPVFDMLWKYTGSIRDNAQNADKRRPLSDEAARYVIGQYSFWSWILLFFEGDSAEEMKEYVKSKSQDGIFESFPNLYTADVHSLKVQFAATFAGWIDDVIEFLRSWGLTIEYDLTDDVPVTTSTIIELNDGTVVPADPSARTPEEFEKSADPIVEEVKELEEKAEA
jgi:hypothetical protein